MKPRHILVYISYEQETIKGSLYTVVISSICYRATVALRGGGGLVVLGRSDKSPFTSPLTSPDLIDPRPSTAAAWLPLICMTTYSNHSTLFLKHLGIFKKKKNQVLY